MKKWIAFATFMSLMSLSAQAQFDDVYYDPARDNRPATTTTRTQTQQPRYDNNGTQPNSDENYYDNQNTNGGGDYYEYDDEYDDYAYSSRIRRFHRPLRGFDYYNTAYVDYGNYDPYYYDRFFSRPNVTIVVGNGYWNRYNRYNRWNNSIWFNRYWNDWCYSGNNYYNPYSFNNFYSPFGYSSYYSPYGCGGGYSSWNDPYYNGGWGFNRYNRYSNPYQTGHTYVNTPLSNAGNNKYYGPRSSGGAIREVTGPSGQTTGRRNDVGVGTTGNNNPKRTNAPEKATTQKEQYSDAPRNGGSTTPTKQRYEAVPSDVRTDAGDSRPTRTTERPAQTNNDRPTRTTETTDRPTRTYERPAQTNDRPQRTTETTDRPTRTYERPAQNYDRPQRTQETTPNNDRPTRTYERPAPSSDRPARTQESTPQRTYERPQRQEAPRQESPRYEAPRQESRQESRSYSPPASSPAPSHSSPAPSSAPARSSGGGGRKD